jgi:hypothetical protein
MIKSDKKCLTITKLLWQHAPKNLLATVLNGRGSDAERMPRADGYFKPGNAGRPKGLKTQAQLEVLEFCRRVLMPDAKARTAYVTNLRARILRGEANHMELYLAQHLWGKPALMVDKTVHYRFSFVGFVAHGGVDPVPASLPGEIVSAAPAGGPPPGPGAAGPDLLAPAQRQGDDLAAVDDLQHERPRGDLLLPLSGAQAGAQDFVGWT